MIIRSWIVPLVLTASVTLAGCGEQAARQDQKPASAKGSDEEARIRRGLDGLSPEDRPLAEAQKYCAVLEKSRLGSMGTPLKIEVEGQSVFLCCKGCEKKALKDPAKTLARVKELKENNAPVLEDSIRVRPADPFLKGPVPDPPREKKAADKETNDPARK
jgi:hypothetical protein